MSEELINAIADKQEENVLALTMRMLASGADPVTILDDCRIAMEIVGKRFEAGEYFLPGLDHGSNVCFAQRAKPSHFSNPALLTNISIDPS